MLSCCKTENYKELLIEPNVHCLLFCLFYFLLIFYPLPQISNDQHPNKILVLFLCLFLSRQFRYRQYTLPEITYHLEATPPDVATDILWCSDEV